jgi:hypothetical protein
MIKFVYLCAMLSWIKSVFVLFVLFVFVGNIGIGVYTHTCKEEGKFTSFYLNLNEHCKDKELVQLPPCCRKAAVSIPISSISEDCCSDDWKLFKIKLDYQSSIEGVKLLGTPVAFASLNFIYCFDFLFLDRPISKQTHPPPIRCGRDILIQHQVFRI